MIKPVSLLAVLLLVPPASASRPAGPADACGPAGACVAEAPVGAVNIKLHSEEGQQVLNAVLRDAEYWADASSSTYTNQLYDEIRLKSLPKERGGGYVPMITGEGDEDFPEEVVADIVFRRNVDLPRYMSGADAIVRLGSGFDAKVGADYADSYYLLDFTLFYGEFTQRMYRKYDEATKQHIMWFEKLDQGFVSPAKWQEYQTRIAKVKEGHDRRWLFNGYQEVTDVYGMFVVSRGEQRQSRVTFVSKITFGDEAGWVAQAGSKMPGVIKAGLKAGFDGCVAIAKDEKAKRAAAAAKPPAGSPSAAGLPQ